MGGLLAVLAVGAPAMGQPPASGERDAAAAPPADAAAEADRRFLEGKALLREGKKEAALAQYRAAFALKQSHDVAGNLGSLELELGFYRDAAEHLSFALRHYAATGTTPAQLEKAKQRLAEARKHVGAVKVTVNVAGAEVLVDGESVGRAPLPGEVFVAPGTRRFEARLAGHEAARADVKAEKGGAAEVTLTLRELAVKEGDGGGGAEGTGAMVPGGAPRVGPSVVHAEPYGEGGGPRKEVLIAGGVVAGLGLVGGVVFTILANARASDVEGQRDELAAAYGPRACTGAGVPAGCADLQDAYGARDTLSNAAVWSFIGAGVVGVATGVYAIAASRKAPVRSGVQVEPRVGATSGGVVLGGRW